MSLIDEALSANATIASDYDPSRGKPPAPRIALDRQRVGALSAHCGRGASFSATW
jgi:hypothetical protein